MKICLISCNIRFDNPADGQNAWQFRRDYLAKILSGHNPVIIATQEGRFHQLHDLKNRLQDFEFTDQHRSWIGERMYPTIFIKNDQFEYLASGDFWLSETPDVAGSFSFGSAFPRLMTWSKLQIKNEERELLIVNTHFDHMKAEVRLEQTKVFIQQIEKIWNKQSLLVIMGDFNDGPDSKVRELLTQAFDLSDAWKLFNTQEETSHHAFSGEMQNGARIDWILTDPRLKVENCIMDKSVNNGVYPSDHFPIVCTVSL